MRINPFKSATFLALGAATLWAADPWEKKDFTQWGEKEIRKVLTDSPWSQSTNVKTGYLPSVGGGAPLGRVSEGSVTRGGGKWQVRGRRQGTPQVGVVAAWGGESAAATGCRRESVCSFDG